MIQNKKLCYNDIVSLESLFLNVYYVDKNKIKPSSCESRAEIKKNIYCQFLDDRYFF